MIRRILLAIAGVLIVAVAGGLLATLWVDPASRAADLPRRLDGSEGSRFLTLPFEGTAGIDIHYLDGGSPAGAVGNDFLLLHGFTFNAHTWAAQLPQFAERGRTIAPDQMPYGLSAKLTPADWHGANPYSREAALALTLALMDELGLRRVVLVGNSSGGTLALEAALAAPDRVSGLVLIAPWVFVRRPVLPRLLTESLPMQRLSLFIARKLGAAGGLLDLSYADPRRISDERRRLAALHTRTRNWDLAWAALLNRSLSTRIDVDERLAGLSQPVLIVAGDADRLVPVEDSRRVAALLPTADFRLLPGCGHVPHEECPEVFAAAISDWLRENGDALTSTEKPDSATR